MKKNTSEENRDRIYTQGYAGLLRRVFATVFVTGLTVCSIFVFGIGRIVSASEAGTESEQERLTRRRQETQERIVELNTLKGDTESYITGIDEELAKIYEELEILDTQIEEVEGQISENDILLSESIIDRDEQYENMKTRIKYIYENGSTSNLELLLSSQDITQLLSRAEYIRSLTNYDNQLITRYKNTISDITRYQSELEEKQETLSSLRSEVESEQQLEQQALDSKKLQLNEYEEELDEANIDLVEIERMQKELDDRLAAQEAEQARKEQEALEAYEKRKEAQSTAPSTEASKTNTDETDIVESPVAQTSTSESSTSGIAEGSTPESNSSEPSESASEDGSTSIDAGQTGGPGVSGSNAGEADETDTPSIGETGGPGSSTGDSGSGSSDSNETSTEEIGPGVNMDSSSGSSKTERVEESIYSVASDGIGSINFLWPCPSSKTISSPFGNRVAPVAGASTNHKGIDISASTGSQIIASASGEVVISEYSNSAGNYIMISHGGGVYTVYMHCSKLLVSVGDMVEAGETIGKVGSTGYSTGPHLHFAIRYDGEYVNPSDYVS